VRLAGEVAVIGDFCVDAIGTWTRRARHQSHWNGVAHSLRAAAELQLGCGAGTWWPTCWIWVSTFAPSCLAGARSLGAELMRLLHARARLMCRRMVTADAPSGRRRLCQTALGGGGA